MHLQSITTPVAGIAITLLALSNSVTAARFKERSDTFVVKDAICINQEKAGQGSDTTKACWEAIAKLNNNQAGKVKGQPGKCKKLEESGECGVFLCGVNTDKSGIARSLVESMASQIHAGCKRGPKNSRATGGEIEFFGMQPAGQDHLTGYIWLGKKGHTPLAEVKRRSVPSRLPDQTTNVEARKVGDSKTVNEFKVVVDSYTEHAARSNRDTANTAAHQATRRWGERFDPTRVDPVLIVGHATGPQGRPVGQQIVTGNNYNLADGLPDSGLLDRLMEAHLDLWEAEGRPDGFTTTIQRDEGDMNQEDWTIVARFIFTESNITNEDKVKFDYNIIPFGSERIQFGSFAEIKRG